MGKESDEVMIGLITNGFCLPYNPELTARANELRKNMTPMENKLWTGFLKNFSLNVMAQKVIDYYIVNFYCPKLHLNPAPSRPTVRPW